MGEKTETEAVLDDYLKTLEKVKKQYQQYVEISELYKLPTCLPTQARQVQKEDEPVQYQPPSPEHPLTTTIRIR